MRPLNIYERLTMFGKKKTTKTLNATCVIPLSGSSVEILRLMQLNHPIPEGAKYIAFLEDGDACFLGEDDLRTGPFGMAPTPRFKTIYYYTDIPIEFEEE
jgi:hypothetical protein